ncbi:MerR family transcriptional regulator [Pantoea sp. AV62]|nr:MerR family transcriptional regulator [Pantoea brenneri]OXM26740.1 MerR family transcriptional regulator [Pantoea sp. AV62]
MIKELDIADVADRSGLAPSALRFYEKKGLIKSIGRKGLRRQYCASVLEKLALITLGRSAGFTLDEIASLFDAQGKLSLDRLLLIAKADEIDNTIRQLKKVRDGLRHVAHCPASDHLLCPEFQKIVRRMQSRSDRTTGYHSNSPAALT